MKVETRIDYEQGGFKFIHRRNGRMRRVRLCGHKWRRTKTLFTGTGSTSTATKFDIQLTNCPETVTSAAVNFGGTPDADNNSTLALTRDADAATGVAIQLLDTAGQPVSLYTPSRQYPLTAGSTVNDLEFGARYIQTQTAVTAGPANSVSTFTIIYN